MYSREGEVVRASREIRSVFHAAFLDLTGSPHGKEAVGQKSLEEEGRGGGGGRVWPSGLAMASTCG